MATVTQLENQLNQEKKKLAKLKKEVTATKANIKQLQIDFKKARAETIAKVAEMRKAKKLRKLKRAAKKK